MDVSSITDKIKERINFEFVSLMDESEWRKMIEIQVKKFIEKPERGYHNDPEPMSKFEIMVTQAMENALKDRIKWVLDGMEWMSENKDLEDLMMKIADRCGAAAIRQFQMETSQLAVQSMQNAISNRGNGGY